MSNRLKGDDIFEVIAVLVIILIGSIGVTISCYHEDNNEEKYGTEKWEIVITDKWEDLGSNWHLVGGRATETEYHIEYKYRCINRPDDEFNSQWRIRTTRVNRSRYNRMHVGNQFIQEDNYLIW